MKELNLKCDFCKQNIDGEDRGLLADYIKHLTLKHDTSQPEISDFMDKLYDLMLRV